MTTEPTDKSIESLMTEERTFPPSDEMRANSYISSDEQYKEMWRQSIEEPDAFWLEQAKSLSWITEPTKSLEFLWDYGSSENRAHLVRGRRAQRVLQLPRSAHGDPHREQDRDCLAG